MIPTHALDLKSPASLGPWSWSWSYGVVVLGEEPHLALPLIFRCSRL